MAKFDFLKRFKCFNKKKSKNGEKQTSHRKGRREGSCNRSSSCSPPVNEDNTSSNAVLVAVFAGVNPPDEEKNNRSNCHRSQHHERLDDLSRGSRTCSNGNGNEGSSGSDPNTIAQSSLGSSTQHHGPYDVDTCQLLLKNKSIKSNVAATSQSYTPSPVAMAPAPIKVVESLPLPYRPAIDRYTHAESFQEEFNIRSSISLQSTTSAHVSEETFEHELELYRPSTGSNIDCVQGTKPADSTARSSTPEKADLLQKHQDECDPSPTSVFLFDSTNGVDINPKNVSHDRKRGNDDVPFNGASQLLSSSEQIDMNNRTTSSASYQSVIASLMSPPAIIRHMPAALFGNATDTSSPVWNHQDTASSSTASPSSATAAKEFLALKKDAEKNEFKKVLELQQHKKSSVPPSPMAIQDGTRKSTKRPGMEEPHETIEIQVNQDKNTRSTQSTEAQFPPDIPLKPSASSDEGMEMHSSPSHSPSNVIVDVIQPSDSQQFLDDMQVDDDTYSDDTCSYDSEFDTIGEITICSETKRLMEAHRLYEDAIKNDVNHPARRRKSILKVKIPIKEIYIEGEKKIAGSGSVSIRTESIKTELSFPTDDIISLPSIETQQRRKITWYDDEAHWNKPFELRTDESFDASSVSYSRVSTRSGYSQNIKQYNAVDQLIGDFIKGIGKYTCFDDEVATSFDAAEQQEI